MQAASVGTLDCLKLLEKKGCFISAVGHIGFSPKKRNNIHSNVIGAAAYYGNQSMLKYLMTKLRSVNINYQAQERVDHTAKGGSLVCEFKGFSPIMLAAASGQVECMKLLLQHQCDTELLDENNNNLYMIAALFGQVESFRFLTDKLEDKVNLLQRNRDGETCFTIAESKKNQKIVDILSSINERYDDSKNMMD